MPAQDFCSLNYLVAECLGPAGSRTCLRERASLKDNGRGLTITHSPSLHQDEKSSFSIISHTFQTHPGSVGGPGYQYPLPGLSQQPPHWSPCLSSPHSSQSVILIKQKPNQVPPLLPITLRRHCLCNVFQDLTSSWFLFLMLILFQPYWLPLFSSQVCSHLRAFALAILFAWNTFLISAQFKTTPPSPQHS